LLQVTLFSGSQRMALVKPTPMGQLDFSSLTSGEPSRKLASSTAAPYWPPLRRRAYA